MEHLKLLLLPLARNGPLQAELTCLLTCSSSVRRWPSRGREGGEERKRERATVSYYQLGWDGNSGLKLIALSTDDRRATSDERRCIILRLSVGLTDWQTKRGSKTDSQTDRRALEGHRAGTVGRTVAICVRWRLICRRCDLMDSWANRRTDGETSAPTRLASKQFQWKHIRQMHAHTYMAHTLAHVRLQLALATFDQTLSGISNVLIIQFYLSAYHTHSRTHTGTRTHTHACKAHMRIAAKTSRKFTMRAARRAAHRVLPCLTRVFEKGLTFKAHVHLPRPPPATAHDKAAAWREKGGNEGSAL